MPSEFCLDDVCFAITVPQCVAIIRRLRICAADLRVYGNVDQQRNVYFLPYFLNESQFRQIARIRSAVSEILLGHPHPPLRPLVSRLLVEVFGGRGHPPQILDQTELATGDWRWYGLDNLRSMGRYYSELHIAREIEPFGAKDTHVAMKFDEKVCVWGGGGGTLPLRAPMCVVASGSPS